MILTEKVKIKVSKNSKYYEDLGYFIPKELETRTKKWVVRRGTEIEVLVEDLQPNSTVLVKSKCDICGKEREQKYYRYRSICANCMRNKVQIGSKHPNWKDGHAIRKQCKCGKEINWNTNQCVDCREKYLSQFRVENYCIDCGKKVSKKSKRCIFCANRGINNPCYDRNLSDDERQSQKYFPGLGKWSNEVKEKDGYVCQKCGYVGEKYDGILQSHHIFNFRDNKNERLNVDNGITLCQECHINFHLKFGKRNNNKNQIKEFLNE